MMSHIGKCLSQDSVSHSCVQDYTLTGTTNSQPCIDSPPHYSAQPGGIQVEGQWPEPPLSAAWW